MAISNGDGSIILKTAVDTSGVEKGMNSIQNIVSEIGKTIAIAFSVHQLVQFGKEATNLASDLQEVQNVVDVAFGSMSEKIEKFADTSIEKFGMSRLTAKRTASTYMAMAKGMGIAEGVASDMAITMTGLTADIASFYNMSQERADVILKSVYTGETETLKQLGIVMTEVNLQNFAYSQGIKKKLSAMTQQEKTMLRYKFVLEQTKLAQGDFARTSDSWANQTRILTERWKEAQAVWGESFIMIGTMLLPVLNNLVDILTQIGYAAQVAARWVYKLATGKEFGSVDTAKQQADAVGETAENQQDVADAVKETAKEQEKMLAGFDELNILSGNTAENMADSSLLMGDVGGTGGDLTEVGEKLNAEEFQENLTKIGMLTGVALMGLGIIMIFMGHPLIGVSMVAAGAVFVASAASENLGEEEKQKLINIAAIAGAALIGLGILLLFTPFKLIGLAMIATGAIALYTALAIGEFSEDVKAKLTNILVISGLVMMAIGAILLFVPGFNLVGVAMLAAGAGELIAAAVMNASDVKDWVLNNLWTILDMAGKTAFILGVILCFVPGMMTWGFGLMVAGIAAVGIAAIVPNYDEIKNTIINFFNENCTAIAAIAAAMVVIGIILLFCGQIGLGLGVLALGATVLAQEIAMNGDVIKETIVSFLKENWEAIVIISAALIIIGIILLFTPFTGVGIGMIAAGAVGLFAEVAANWDAVSQYIIQFVHENYDIIMGISTGLVVIGVLLLCSGFWGIGLALLAAGVGGLWGATKLDSSAVANELQGELDSLNDTAQEGVNKINETLAQIQFSNNWQTGGTMGFGSTQFSALKVPKLARGAVIPPNREFLAVLGDQKSGTNIEAPLDTITQAFTSVLNASGMVGGGSHQQSVVLKLDDQVLAKTLLNIEQKNNRRIGLKLEV